MPQDSMDASVGTQALSACASARGRWPRGLRCLAAAAAATLFCSSGGSSSSRSRFQANGFVEVQASVPEMACARSSGRRDSRCLPASASSTSGWRAPLSRSRHLGLAAAAASPESPEDNLDEATGIGYEEDENEEDEDKEEPLFFGGASEERQAPEESEVMRIASRINQALVMKRQPAPAPVEVLETGWYEELGIEPTATQDEILLRYLEVAEEVEERLAYLLEEGGKYEEKVVAQDDEEDDEFNWDNDEAITLQSEDAITPLEGTQDEAMEEAEIVAEDFTRISNLYQILSVPQLRKIYDEGGVEGLAMRVPALRKGLMEPERVLKLAKGIKLPTKVRESLLLRREPREKTFRRYQGKNSIRQVLRRLTDGFHVWCFKSPESLKFREGTIYTELPEIAVFGRVNSGKSAMLSHLMSSARPPRQRGLFRVGKMPGKTNGINTFCINRRFTIADMPGYGRGDLEHESAISVHENWKTQYKGLIQAYLKSTKQLRAAIYVHDIAKDVTRQDLKLVQMLKEQNIPTLLVFTKDDKVDSDTHRQSRVRYIRRKLGWPLHLPHAHYTTRKGHYGQVFKNMVGTMMLGLLGTDQREDAHTVLMEDIPEIFWDYRDKYVPRPRTKFGKIKAEKKVRTYPGEDKVYTDEELAEEEEIAEKRERRRLRKEKKARGEKFGLKEKIEEVAGEVLTPKERRERWESMLAASKA